jgi:hypothetical protein
LIPEQRASIAPAAHRCDGFQGQILPLCSQTLRNRPSSSSPLAIGYFAAASTVIAIPFGLAGLIIFVLGGITGVMVASPPFDLQRRWRGSSDRRA